jgi:hypothetical protein
MAQIKVSIGKMPVPKKIQFVRQIVQEMTKNRKFNSPSPDLTTLTGAAASLEAAYNTAQAARANAKEQTSIMNQRVKALETLVMQEASYVQSVSGGDKAVIESAGFGVRSEPTRIGQLEAPAHVKVTPGPTDGSVHLNWRKVHGARAYNVERALDSDRGLEWVTVFSSSKTRAVVNSMHSGHRYWFRVAAIGSAGQGAWSDAVSKIAP